MSWLLDRLVECWMARCPHNDADVAADILEGAALPRPGYEVQLCRRCGAVQVVFVDSCCVPERVGCGWRRPRPMWAERHDRLRRLADAKRSGGGR